MAAAGGVRACHGRRFWTERAGGEAGGVEAHQLASNSARQAADAVMQALQRHAPPAKNVVRYRDPAIKL
jgi:hypothetical protein